MNNEDTPQLSPEDFGRRAAEAMAPILEESLRRIMDEFVDNLRESMPDERSAKSNQPAQWTGGTPTSEQAKAIVDRSSAVNMASLATDVSDIKAAVQQMANNAGGAAQ